MSIQIKPPAASSTTTNLFRSSDPKKQNPRSHPHRLPIFISTNPTHATQSLPRLAQLYTLCNHSCHRFPNLDPHGLVLDPVDPIKLGVAVSHSLVVVSVFARMEEERMGWWDRLVPVTPENGRLVGFGRAVSDVGLTASIYDVMVIPSLRGMGIGRMIVQKILRMLTSRGIYDISAVCSGDERLFFEACGFGDDLLGSTAMMYARTASSHIESREIVQAGRILLVSPPPSCSLQMRKSFTS